MRLTRAGLAVAALGGIFSQEQCSLMKIPWSWGGAFAAEWEAIASSVPEVPACESSDGMRFIEMAQIRALQGGDVEYVRR